MSSEWREVRLGEVADTLNGAGIKQEYFADEGVPLARVSNFSSGTIDLSGCIFVDRLHAERWSTHRINYGDVIVATVGSWPPNWSSVVGKVVRAPVSAAGSIQNQNSCRVISRKDMTDQRFLYYLLSTQDFIIFAANSAAGSANQARLGVASLEKFSFLMPPIDEQKDIAKFLGALDDRIALLRETNTTLEAIAQAIFKSWFVDFDPVRAKMEGREPEGMDAETAALFPDSFEESEFGLVPKGWRVGSIYEIARVIYGAPFASKQFNVEGLGYPLVRIRDLKDESPGVYTEEKHPKGYMIQPGDLVVGMDGEFRAYLWGGQPAWLNQRVCVFAATEGVPTAFVHRSITPLLAAVEASETATTVIHLGKNDIDRFRVVLPSQSVLTVFAEVAEPIYAKIVANKQTIFNLANLRDTLLPRLISGQLRLPEGEDQMAEAVA